MATTIKMIIDAAMLMVNQLIVKNSKAIDYVIGLIYRELVALCGFGFPDLKIFPKV